MALSNEEKAAKKLIASIDSLGLNPAMIAFAVTNEAVSTQQDLLFRLVCALVKQWAEHDVLSTHYAPTLEEVQRKVLSTAMRDAVEKQGYTIW